MRGIITYGVRLSNGKELTIRAINVKFVRMGIEQWCKDNNLEYGPDKLTIVGLYDMDVPTFIEGGSDISVNLA